MKFAIRHLLAVTVLLGIGLAWHTSQLRQIETGPMLNSCRQFLGSYEHSAVGKISNLAPLLAYRLSSEIDSFEIAICVARFVEKESEQFALVKMARNTRLADELNSWGECYGTDEEPLIVILNSRPTSDDILMLEFPENGKIWNVHDEQVFYQNWKQFAEGNPPVNFEN